MPPLNRANFTEMGLDDLIAHILFHRDDKEAIYTYYDRRQKQQFQKYVHVNYELNKNSQIIFNSVSVQDVNHVVY